MPQVSSHVSWDSQNNVPVVRSEPHLRARGQRRHGDSMDLRQHGHQFSDCRTRCLPVHSSATSGPVTVFTSTDRNTGVGNYNYTVTATHAVSGKSAQHDPRIVNGGGPTS